MVVHREDVRKTTFKCDFFHELSFSRKVIRKSVPVGVDRTYVYRKREFKKVVSYKESFLHKNILTMVSMRVHRKQIENQNLNLKKN